MIIIAVDGPAGAGKGTISKYICKNLNLQHIDTGLFYRALGHYIMTHNIATDDTQNIIASAKNITSDDIQNPSLRDEHVASFASKVAVIPDVRRILTQKIRELAENIDPKYDGVIMDGRDVGTHIFPNADVKLYITADANVRAHRRILEKGFAQNQKTTFTTKSAITERDSRDSNRTSDPLKISHDAIVVDTTNLDIDAACLATLDKIKSVLSAKNPAKTKIAHAQYRAFVIMTVVLNPALIVPSIYAFMATRNIAMAVVNI